MAENYWTTSVSIARSADAIQQLLVQFGAERFALIQDWKGGRLAVQFSYRGYPVEFGVDMHQVAQTQLLAKPWNAKRRCSKVVYERAIEEKAGKVAMRILAHHLKAALIAVEYGLVSFEDVFLAKFLCKNGQTVGEALVPKLAEAIAQPGRLLSAGGKS